MIHKFKLVGFEEPITYIDSWIFLRSHTMDFVLSFAKYNDELLYIGSEFRTSKLKIKVCFEL